MYAGNLVESFSFVDGCFCVCACHFSPSRHMMEHGHTVICKAFSVKWFDLIFCCCFFFVSSAYILSVASYFNCVTFYLPLCPKRSPEWIEYSGFLTDWCSFFLNRSIQWYSELYFRNQRPLFGTFPQLLVFQVWKFWRIDRAFMDSFKDSFKKYRANGVSICDIAHSAALLLPMRFNQWNGRIHVNLLHTEWSDSTGLIFFFARPKTESSRFYFHANFHYNQVIIESSIFFFGNWFGHLFDFFLITRFLFSWLNVFPLYL